MYRELRNESLDQKVDPELLRHHHVCSPRTMQMTFLFDFLKKRVLRQLILLSRTQRLTSNVKDRCSSDFRVCLLLRLLTVEESGGSGLSNTLSTNRLHNWHIYIFLIYPFIHVFTRSINTNYVQCYVLSADLSPKLELLPNMICFLSVAKKGTLHVGHAQTKEKVVLNRSPMIRIMGHQSNHTSEPSRAY